MGLDGRKGQQAFGSAQAFGKGNQPDMLQDSLRQSLLSTVKEIIPLPA